MSTTLDVSAQRLLAGVEALVSDSRGDPVALSATLERLEDVETVSGRTRYRLFNFDLEIDAANRHELLKGRLDELGTAGVVAAPEFVRSYPLADGYSIAALRYRSPGLEKVVRASDVGAPFSEEARYQLRRDLQSLVEKGLVHPYIRGYAHWLVGAKSGRLFLYPWDVVRAGKLSAQLEMLEDADRLLRQRATGSHVSRVFDRRRVLLPVIHPQSEREALQSVEVAIEARCAGIWLINQGMSVDEVLKLVMTVRAKHPFLWVGVNLLGLSPAAALEKALGACGNRIDGIWSDDADVDERSTEQPDAKAFLAVREKHYWQGSYFGGVAFKYQREIADDALAKAAAAAAPFLDVVCSSGPGTGKAADPQKLARLREGLGKDGSLAVASGITAENIDSFLPYVDAYLVGTGIERSFGVLDADKVTAVQQRIDAWLAANPAA